MCDCESFRNLRKGMSKIILSFQSMFEFMILIQVNDQKLIETKLWFI